MRWSTVRPGPHQPGLLAEVAVTLADELREYGVVQIRGGSDFESVCVPSRCDLVDGKPTRIFVAPGEGDRGDETVAQDPAAAEPHSDHEDDPGFLCDDDDRTATLVQQYEAVKGESQAPVTPGEVAFDVVAAARVPGVRGYEPMPASRTRPERPPDEASTSASGLTRSAIGWIDPG